MNDTNMADAEEDMEMDSNSLAGPYRFDDTEEFEVDENGSISLRATLDKDYVQCCVCYSHMTGSIYKCLGTGRVAHNVCFDCEWQMRRLKQLNGHVKPQRCPICKLEGRLGRNYNLEQNLQAVCKPCSHKHNGCEKKFFRWCEDARKEHENTCVYGTVSCPLCGVNINGCLDMVEHLQSEACQLGKFTRIAATKSPARHNNVEIPSHENSFVFNEKNNYLITFIWRETHFEIIAFNTNGNFQGCTMQVSLDIVDSKKWNEYNQEMKENTINHYYVPLPVPQRSVLHLNMAGFKANCGDAENQISPALESIQDKAGHFFTGKLPEKRNFNVRFYTLKEILSQGCTLDCRDFLGKWYEAEVMEISEENPFGCCDKHPATDRKRIHVHYLGYSASYDEWFDLGDDTSRIAPSGTYTVGPNLRTVRRGSTHSSVDRRRRRQESSAQLIAHIPMRGE